MAKKENYLNKRNLLIFISIILLTILIYWPSFTAPFFQDDIIFLTSPKISDFFTALPQGIYRPLSFQLFYSVGRMIFGLNPLGFHLILFFISSLSLYLIFRLSQKIFNNDLKAHTVVFFYAFNVSLFANYYWIAVSYFVLGNFFIFLSLYLLWIKKSQILSTVSYIAALLSNEVLFVFPLLLILTFYYFRKWKKFFAVFLSLDIIYLILKTSVFGLPKSSSYTTSLFAFLPLVRWYLFRALNLPEGIKRSSDYSIFILFILFLILFAYGFFYYIKSRKINYRLFIFSLLWFFMAALPFFFLPNHMSSFYLTVSLFAVCLVFAEIFSVNPKILISALIVYFLLTWRGLTFLSQTHWIILKNTGPIGTL
ncbi:hypothetical protein A2153_05980 [Candidatus Gottesmanbacteria bacterium RBG_16_38_7b]|uniref:Glycosyltransferase RgtA/B/C/D-like domain-containing protein n=1 Tax=Candidatus Gottesmanbacteria bacterium RBG_16_38_7b TaxID=1798372 RepID=A0A1F5YLC9_9BACT|nr:MAG: hypothetical protein A2153_05980 [Candidatus Gottesmanbacteria bacterium RBG_16_38_7b]